MKVFYHDDYHDDDDSAPVWGLNTGGFVASL